MPADEFYKYLPDGLSFVSTAACGIKTIYFPLCGPDSLGLKSAITPFLSGDIKLDKFHYLTKPASREDLRQPARAFFVFIKGKGVFSLSKESAPHSSRVEAGGLWHKLTRTHKAAGLELIAINFIPVDGTKVELMSVEVKNVSRKTIKFTPTFAVPLFGRSLANKHDHEHVTALLNRISQETDGVLVVPTMSFNEEGHKANTHVYFAYGCEGSSKAPVGSFPTVDSFYADAGCLLEPAAVVENHKPRVLKGGEASGKEAMGALRFREATLKAGGSQTYILAVGMASEARQSKKIFAGFNSDKKFEAALEANKKYWSDKMASVVFKTGDGHFNSWMRWVVLQPVFRRIFGCSFLPDHDYGKGGRGWRDIWQDLLSLILIEPQQVRQDLINNCGGIRIDGSNATIIGSRPGEFLADRNAITRVWMDHGAWPLLTLLLYVDQSGDLDILLERQSYFRDPQLSRTKVKDISWANEHGHKLVDKKGQVYEGSILEHLLVQHLTQFFNVGEHNIIRLENADWNDGLDMGAQRGESTAFTSFYGGNLFKLADILEDLQQRQGTTKVRLFSELLSLLDTFNDKIDYNDPQAKHGLLFNKYFHQVQPALSGETVEVAINDLVADLRAKGQWIFDHLRRQEKVQLKDGGREFEWFNGYYDNNARRVEGLVDKNVRMTLTGQVFSIMSGMATQEEIKGIISSVEKFLRNKQTGGYHLNTDFGVDRYLELGRAFSFAYGSKENGAYFSHMNVMYAAALYRRGFAREGYKVLQSIYHMAREGERSKIYPGIPEYFDLEGRGMYHYLTGSASWLVLTMLTDVFGVRGLRGDLVLEPQLVREEFDAKGIASVSCQFAGRRLTIEYHNPRKLDAGKYSIKSVAIEDKLIEFKRLAVNKTLIPRISITQDAIIKVSLA